jgi:excisionase family DNA binding protein
LFSKKKGGFDMEKEICGIKEIAKYLNISESGVRKLVREKRIPYFKVLSCIKFDIKEINKWVNESTKRESKVNYYSSNNIKNML